MRASYAKQIINFLRLDKYNDVLKLFRITSYVLRFINNLKKKMNTKEGQNSMYPTVEEMREAHTLWIKVNQIHLM